MLCKGKSAYAAFFVGGKEGAVILDVSGQADQCQAYQNADPEEKNLAAGNGGICRVYCINKLVKKAGWDH